MSVLQTPLQRAHLCIIPLLLTFVAHHDPFPSILGTHPVYSLALCLKGKRQSSVTPMPLSKFLPWPAALHTTNLPEEDIRGKRCHHIQKIKFKLYKKGLGIKDTI